MKTQIGDNIYSIGFNYGMTSSEHRRKGKIIYSDRPACICIITQTNISSGETRTLASGQVVRYYKDHEDREQARQAALRKAVYSGWAGLENRDCRTALFSAYFNRRKQAESIGWNAGVDIA